MTIVRAASNSCLPERESVIVSVSVRVSVRVRASVCERVRVSVCVRESGGAGRTRSWLLRPSSSLAQSSLLLSSLEESDTQVYESMGLKYGPSSGRTRSWLLRPSSSLAQSCVRKTSVICAERARI